MAPEITGTPAESDAPRSAQDQPLIRSLRLFVYACFAFGLTAPGQFVGGIPILGSVGMAVLIGLRLMDSSSSGRRYFRWTLLLVTPALLAYAYGAMHGRSAGWIILDRATTPVWMIVDHTTVRLYVLGMAAWLYLSRVPGADIVGGYTLFALFPLVAPLVWMVASILPRVQHMAEVQLLLGFMSIWAVMWLPLTIGIALIASRLDQRPKKRSRSEELDRASRPSPT